MINLQITTPSEQNTYFKTHSELLQQRPVVEVSYFMVVYIAPGFPTHALLRCSLRVKQIAYQGLLRFHTETSTFPFQRLVETLFVLGAEFLLEIKWF